MPQSTRGAIPSYKPKLIFPLVLTGLAALLSFPSSGLSQTYYRLLPGQKAIVSFHFNGPTIVNGVVPNLLALQIGSGVPFDSHLSGVAYSLFDGPTLLGAVVRNEPYSSAGQAFRSLDNPLPTFTPAASIPVDFSGILDGSILGRIVCEPLFTNPTEADWLEAEFEFLLLKQYDNYSGARCPDPIVDSIEILQVPEPASWTLLGFGLAALLGRRPR